ncbi:hypothetical protein ARALYDRAFT_908537 [Arabidopsis lyrata subsp. lyrata]|uniref:Uncharacterized protein n=1 Tax=Arabidopsis lyrata subsp. lyrata TaxID=81972 RepID=D7LZ48_ARALL|nr:hypothetical protein ARALYDRAFT_908537 [Arabidopsis lyrata subsp. lyrata]
MVFSSTGLDFGLINITLQVEATKKISEYVSQLRRLGKGHGNHLFYRATDLKTKEIKDRWKRLRKSQKMFLNLGNLAKDMVTTKYVYKIDETKELSGGCVQMEAKAFETSPLSI